MQNITINDFLHFPGEWSLSPYTIYLALKYCTYNEKINILEFGSGTGTECLIKFLTDKNISFNYTSVEHDKQFANNSNVNYIFYNLKSADFFYDSSEDVKNVNLDLKDIYDLIIIDGPHGISRKFWYEKIINNIKSGTIIVVDDYHHFKDFETELYKNFKFDIINEFSAGTKFTPTDINQGIEQVNTNLPFNFNKTHIIVKITQ